MLARMKYWIIIALMGLGSVVFADGVPPFDAGRMARADVVILGEVHDNPAHHQKQAALAAKLQPAALVFEMLTEEQAAKGLGDIRRDEVALGVALAWAQTGWPDFAYYFPIFSAAPQAKIFGANLTRGVSRKVLDVGIATYFGERAARYGLDQPLSAEQQSARETFQHAAHCDALPENMLAMMVDLQRLRDAMLARAVVRAMAQTGGPVVVITGNGHARKDKGLAVYLQLAQPGLKVFALGQSEGGQIDGDFDAVLDYPVVERPDPCLAFAKQD